LSPPKALLLIGYLTDDLGKPQPQPSILQTIRNVNERLLQMAREWKAAAMDEENRSSAVT
jgi:hypothetical protein